MQPNNQQPIQTSQQKKKRYTTWWGILLIIFIYIPIGLVVFIMVFAVNNPHQQSFNEDNTPDKVAAKEQKQAQDQAKERQSIIKKYSTLYCKNRTNMNMRTDPELTNNGWPTYDGRHNWTVTECTTIITKLYDTGTSEDWIAEISTGRKIGIGMNSMEVIYSLGYPSDINTTTTSTGTREQWVYGDYDAGYVYLDNGVVTSYQQ